MTPYEYLESYLNDVLTSGEIAEVAGKTPDSWVSSVFYGIDNSFDIRKNHFNCPFLEYEITNSGYDQEAIDGGANIYNIQVKVYSSVFPTNKRYSQIQINKIMVNILNSVKSNEILSIMDDVNITEIESTNWGFSQNLTFSVTISYSNDFGISL